MGSYLPTNFSYTLAVCSAVILALLILRQVKCWRWRIFISPGFYFGVFWLIGVIGSSIFFATGYLPNFYPKDLNELNFLVGFTGLAFYILTPKGIKKVKAANPKFCFLPNKRVYRALSVIVFTIALWNFIAHGASFDMGAARQAMHENVANQSILVGYAQVLALGLSICAGIFWCQFFLGERRFNLISKIFLFLPLLTQLLFSIYLGGRVNFIYCVVQYAIGFFLYLPFKSNKKLSKRLIFYILAGGILLSTFISLVAAQRQEHYYGKSAKYDSVVGNSYVMAVLYGPMEYMTASYVGYELRKNDLVDLNKKYYGTCTLNGFINWKLPFSGLYGLGNFSIANVFDVYYDNQEAYDYQRMYYYTTNSCYIPIVKDFGNGILCLIFIFALTWISHVLFVRIQTRKQIRYMSSFLLFYLFLEYWMKSNFYGTLSASILMPLYGFLIIDICNHFSKKPKY